MIKEMARIPKGERWTLADLADFEAELAEEGAEKGARRIYQKSVGPELPRDLDEGERRRRGLRLWLEKKRGDEDRAGHRLETGLSLAGLVAKVVALLAGIGIVRGLLHELPSVGGRGYNIWLFLGVTLGLQWLFLVGGGIAWVMFRRKGRLSWAQELMAFLGKKFAGSRVSPIWTKMLRMRSDGYGSVLTWRLAGITQLAAVWLGLGMVISFLVCVWFLKVNFYWESTVENLSQTQLVKVTNALAFPWSWAGDQWVPGEYGVDQVREANLADPFQAAGADPRAPVNQVWMKFLVLALLVWGVLPRLLLHYYCSFREKKALAGLDFQEGRHRNLWREMAKVERTVVKTGQADGVVLLDVGGTGVPLEVVRPFLLQQMRVNPEALYQTGVLDSGKETTAFEAMKEAALGVVLAVEGWSLSGPQMMKNYQKVREVIGEKKPIRFLVLGTVKGAGVTEVKEAEMAEWIKFVDGLRDPAVEVVRWEDQ